MAIPLDIIDSIIEAVDDDTRLLKRCSLVSSEFLLPSRKRLFSRISFSNNEHCQRLYQFLVENPVLQSFVRTINIYLDYDEDEYDSLISTLRFPFSSLENFSVFGDESHDRSGWNDFSSELKDALLTTIHSSTLKTLHLTSINVPIMLFQGIHLTKLVLNSVSPLFDLDDKQSKLLTPPAPEEEEVATTASHTVIDQIVWKFDEPMYDLPDPMFLPFMSHLRVLEIYVNPYSTTNGHFSILTFLIRSLRVSSSSATLEHLKFRIMIKVDEEDMPDSIDEFYDDMYSDIVWRYLDSITSHPTGSRLRRVDLDISYRDDDGEIRKGFLGPILDELPLLREKGILFA